MKEALHIPVFSLVRTFSLPKFVHDAFSVSMASVEAVAVVLEGGAEAAVAASKITKGDALLPAAGLECKGGLDEVLMDADAL